MELQVKPIPAKLPSVTPPELERVAGLDVARVIACVAVIWFHAADEPYAAIGYFRNPFFAGLLGYLAATGVVTGKHRELGEFARGRAMRLLVPFVLWLILYSICGWWTDRTLRSAGAADLLTGMRAMHLWFLPFAFCASLVVWGVSWIYLHLPRGWRLAGAWLILGVGLAWSFLRIRPLTFTDIAALWSAHGGAVLVGTALGFLHQDQRVRLCIERGWLAWMVLFPLIVAASMNVTERWDTGLFAVSGIMLLLVGLAMPIRRGVVALKYLGQLTYGMYLSHFGLIFVGLRLGFKGSGTMAARYVLVVAASAALTAGLQQFRWGRVLVGASPPPRAARTPLLAIPG